MSRKKLIEAINQTLDVVDDDRKWTDYDLNEWLYDSIDVEYLNDGEERVVAKVGERFFRYHQHPAIGMDWTSIEEVEPYDKIVTKYRPK